MTKAVVLHSGGLDSSTCLAIAVDEHGADEVVALSMWYGQKHTREIDAAIAVAAHYGVTHDEIGLPSELFRGSGSALLPDDGREMPQMSYEELSEQVGPSPTYVPYRNGALLSLAAAYALARGAEELYFGAHSEDAHNFAYPDCTPEFIGAQAAAIYIGTYHKIRLVSPLMWMTKAEVVATGINYDVPFELTWSCYEGGEVACGLCPTCQGRIHAFAENNMDDPIPYAMAPQLAP
jgi:7-cyano-7-deazaguanine synthase